MTNLQRVEAVAKAIEEIRKTHASNKLIKAVCKKYKINDRSVRMVAGWK